MIIAAFAIGGPEKCSGLEIVQYNADKLLTELGGNFELLKEASELHLTPNKKQQKFVYFHFIRKQV
ncbi:hypothetical protein MNBD_GAMMA09-18 [hydrothermal vent metagenome]|uniref:Uncharacterized protein n=1 Tax=hydrothermal vent metagenome TaxID=652676 RepID=A0A3B0Y2V0_9ZZZZ